MKKFLKRIYYTIFLFRKKDILLERDELILSMKALKGELNDEKRKKYASTVFSKVEELSAFKKSKNILFYWSIPSELPTHEYVKKWSQTKNIILLSVKGKDFRLKKFIKCEIDENGRKAIVTEPFDGEVELAVITAIAFDENKYRMGHGKGFYNKFLEEKRKTHKIGVGFDFQVVENIPNCWNEQKMDMIITPSMVVN